MTVPRGQIYTKAQATFPAGFRHFRHHVTLSATERAILYRMFRIPAGPQTEPIVVFTGEDQTFHPGGPDGLYPRSGIEFFRVKNRFRLGAVSPLPPGKGVHREMNKGIKFRLLKGKLPWGRHHLYQPFILCHCSPPSSFSKENARYNTGLMDMSNTVSLSFCQRGEGFRSFAGHAAPGTPRLHATVLGCCTAKRRK